MERFKLGFDVTSKRVVHIDQAKPGLDTAICPDCKSVLVASNLDVVNRKRDTYFRHKVSASCSQMTLMHLWAQQIISESATFLLPPITLEATERDTSKEVHSFRKIIESKCVSIEDATLEKRIAFGNESLVADVFLIDNLKNEFVVEVFVTHKSSSEKIQHLKNHNIEAIEVELLPAPDGILDNPDRFKVYVLEETRRYWLHCLRYGSEIENLKNLARMAAEENSLRLLELAKLKESDREMHCQIFYLIYKIFAPARMKYQVH